MSTLRQQLIQQMQLKGYCQRTIKSYVNIIAQIASFYHLPADQLSIDQIRDYLLKRITVDHLSKSWMSMTISAIKLLFCDVLKREWNRLDLPRPRMDHKKVIVLSKDEVQARVKSPIYVGALFDHDGTALVDPARLEWGLEKVCLSLGVKIFENSKVDWLEYKKDHVIVHSPYGTIKAKKVALATNVFKSLVRSARKYVVPVYDYQLVTEPLTPEQRASIGWSGREGLSDSGNQFHYYRLTND